MKLKKGIKGVLKGFTLIELLVVIAIIGILATIIIINVAAARTKAVDSKMMSEMDDANKTAMSCTTDGGTLNTITAGGVICQTANAGLSGTATWPVATGTTTAYGNWQIPSTAPGTTGWTLTATNVGSSPLKTITCDQTGCRKFSF
jgi:prepilin-type N-terminal cleavage/methylation domain-containing protein